MQWTGLPSVNSPMKYLKQIGSSSYLRSAELYMNIQSPCTQQRPNLYTSAYLTRERENAKGFCTSKERFQKPFLNKKEVEKLFTFMLDVHGGHEATGSGEA
jgi:hypothetical protein